MLQYAQGHLKSNSEGYFSMHKEICKNISISEGYFSMYKDIYNNISDENFNMHKEITVKRSLRSTSLCTIYARTYYYMILYDSWFWFQIVVGPCMEMSFVLSVWTNSVST